MTKPTNPELRQLFEFLDGIAKKTSNNAAICEARQMVFDLEVCSEKKQMATPLGTYNYKEYKSNGEPSQLIDFQVDVVVEFPSFEDFSDCRHEPMIKFR